MDQADGIWNPLIKETFCSFWCDSMAIYSKSYELFLKKRMYLHFLVTLLVNRKFEAYVWWYSSKSRIGKCTWQVISFFQGANKQYKREVNVL